MFEKEMAEKLHRIFKVNKVTYNAPGESKEQDVLFVEIEKAKPQIKPPRALFTVRGNGYMIGQAEKIPFGFFAKAIAEARREDLEGFNFLDLEGNEVRYMNLIQRQFSFVYFFDGQFDPAQGSITSVDFIFNEEL